MRLITFIDLTLLIVSNEMIFNKIIIVGVFSERRQHRN